MIFVTLFQPSCYCLFVNFSFCFANEWTTEQLIQAVTQPRRVAAMSALVAGFKLPVSHLVMSKQVSHRVWHRLERWSWMMFFGRFRRWKKNLNLLSKWCTILSISNLGCCLSLHLVIWSLISVPLFQKDWTDVKIARDRGFVPRKWCVKAYVFTEYSMLLFGSNQWKLVMLPQKNWVRFSFDRNI